MKSKFIIFILFTSLLLYGDNCPNYFNTFNASSNLKSDMEKLKSNILKRDGKSYFFSSYILQGDRVDEIINQMEKEHKRKLNCKNEINFLCEYRQNELFLYSSCDVVNIKEKKEKRDKNKKINKEEPKNLIILIDKSCLITSRTKFVNKDFEEVVKIVDKKVNESLPIKHNVNECKNYFIEKGVGVKFEKIKSINCRNNNIEVNVSNKIETKSICIVKPSK